MKKIKLHVCKQLLVLLLSFPVLAIAQGAPSFTEDPKELNQKWVPVTELTDEFNGNGIDDTKWDDLHPHWTGRAPSEYLRENTTVSGGYLRLKSTLQRDPSTVADPLKDIWVNAASCVSKERSAVHGYYYEANFKASSLSMTSSFWFRVGDFSEIDVIEHIGNPSREDRQNFLPYKYGANTHYYGKHAGLAQLPITWRMPVRARDGFHTYGLWWRDPNMLIFYWDGQEVMRLVPRVSFDESLKMIFDTEVFPFNTDGVPNIGLPTVENLNDDTMNTMLVDWVRAWKLEANDNQVFHIQNRATGKYIRPQFDTDGSPIVQAPSDWRGAWTQWEMIPTSGEYFYLRNRQTGDYFRPISDTDPSNLEQKYTTNIGDRTQWRKVESSDGYFYLENKWTEMYIRPSSTDDLSASTGNDFNIIQRPKSYSANFTQWRFVEVGSTAKSATSKLIDTNFDFYPNPTAEALNIKTGNKSYSVSINDMSGRRVQSFEIGKHMIKQIPLANLRGGVYLINYKSEDSATMSTKKLIVE